MLTTLLDTAAALPAPAVFAVAAVLLGNRVGPHVLTHAGWVPVVVVVLLIGTLTMRMHPDPDRSVGPG